MNPVSYDPHHRIWALNARNSSYVLRLDDGDDAPRQLHWGPHLTPEQALTTPPLPPPGNSFAGTARGREEYPTEAGASYGPAALLIRFADGSRGVEWQYLNHTVDGGHLAIRWRDRRQPLEIVLHYRVYEDSDVVERWAELRHTGTSADDAPLTLHRVDSAAWSLPHRPDYRISHVIGAWGRETQLRRTPLPYAELVLTSRRGVTGHDTNPWVMLDAGDATEDTGEVWSSALAWSGSWHFTAWRAQDDQVRWSGGAGHDGLTWRLRPGERWQTPVFAGLYSADGFGGTSRAWHTYQAGHVLPQPDELRPVVYNSWEATGFDVDEAGQMRLAALAAGVGAELFVMDDGWFGARRDDTAGLGDWTSNPKAFPDGLHPLIDEVHRLGMRFGLWVEPEMVNPDSDLYRRHPDWVLHMPSRERTTLRNQLVLNFARPDVAAWAHAWLNRLVTDHAIDFLKWDMNRPFSEAGWPERGEDADLLWFEHVRQVYAVMDRLRADHPHLRIEACAGGGGRADLGVLARTDQVWTSDNTDAVDRIAIQHGYSQLYPARTMGAWVTDCPNPFTGRTVPLRFRFHIAMAGALGLGGDLTRWTPDELAEAACLVARYKDIRPVVQHGLQYRLDGDGVQYAHGDRTVVIAWRVAPAHGDPTPPLRLRGLDPAARYRDERTGLLHHGAVLMHHGLPLDLSAGDHASMVIRLNAVGQG
ncbi:alpha-galactosidase [Streptomyces sp. APSN-46.1]|uniref:alpha-galactosidase n=1 Tax=Streptomyces sp. APSN-46.1 TaxID=2929049 RepID=UPI001FB3B5F6|nr:alpha-galactosidase [Streptomyces sp. APSN-46.1]MCJ1676148.1 alpha-galactosidase [Streptomyces sp. APSN-46.1]